MGDILRIPKVVVHKIDSGGALTGVFPDGIDSLETLFRGRYREYTECTDGGLLTLDASLTAGFKVERATWNLTGLTGVNLYLVDRDGMSFLIGDGTGANAYFDWRNDGFLVPPGCSLKAVSQGGTLSADGAIMFVLASGWGNDIFNGVNNLGRGSSLPNEF